MRKILIGLFLLLSFNVVGETTDNQKIRVYERLAITIVDASSSCNAKAIYGQHYRYEKERNTSLQDLLSKAQDNETIQGIINDAYQTEDSLNPLQYGFSVYDKCMAEYWKKTRDI